MKKLLFTIALVFTAFSASAITVIVHPSNADSIDEKMIARLFLGKAKSFPSGTKAIPIALAEGAGGAEEFNSKILKKSSSQLKAFWSKQVFTGKGQPPQTADSDAEMIQLISANPNMIGFIEGDGDSSVKVVASY